MPDGYRDVLANLGRESRHVRTDVVGGRRHSDEAELTAIICGRRTFTAGLSVHHFDRCSGHDASGGVSDGPCDLARCAHALRQTQGGSQ